MAESQLCTSRHPIVSGGEVVLTKETTDPQVANSFRPITIISAKREFQFHRNYMHIIHFVLRPQRNELVETKKIKFS